MSLRPKFKASFVEDKQMAPHEEWNGTNSLFSCLLIILLLRDDLIIIIWHNFSKDLDVKPERPTDEKLCSQTEQGQVPLAFFSGLQRGFGLSFLTSTSGLCSIAHALYRSHIALSNTFLWGDFSAFLRFRWICSRWPDSSTSTSFGWFWKWSKSFSSSDEDLSFSENLCFLNPLNVCRYLV